jgi:hypothetical protein
MEKAMGTEVALKLVWCTCGRLHVTYGGITLRFYREEFLSFAEGVRRLAEFVKRPPTRFLSATESGGQSKVCH